MTDLSNQIFFLITTAQSRVCRADATDIKPTFSVQQNSLNQYRVLCNPLGHQQDAFWDIKPPHSAATSHFLGENKEREAPLKENAHITNGKAHRGRL